MQFVRDADEMVFNDPSGNTDQGDQRICEYLGDKTLMRNESKGESSRFTEVGTLGSPLGHYQPIISLVRDLSKSISVETRKMVIYA